LSYIRIEDAVKSHAEGVFEEWAYNDFDENEIYGLSCDADTAAIGLSGQYQIELAEEYIEEIGKDSFCSMLSEHSLRYAIEISAASMICFRAENMAREVAENVIKAIEEIESLGNYSEVKPQKSTLLGMLAHESETNHEIEGFFVNCCHYKKVDGGPDIDLYVIDTAIGKCYVSATLEEGEET